MPPIQVALMMGAGVLFAAWTIARGYRYTQRQRDLPVIARKAGLQYAETDRFNSSGVAFPLFREGEDRLVTNVMWRAAPPSSEPGGSGSSEPDEPGEPVAPAGPPTARVFDYSYSDVYRSTSGRTTEITHTFTSALAQHNGNWPAIRIAPEGLLSRAFQKVGLPDIDFESEEFNRTFVVQCDDRRFASALIDPQMMTFLLAAEGDLTFETKGRFLLAWTKQLDARTMPNLLGVAEEFLRRVPPAVRELYESFPAGAGTDLFPLPPMSERAPSGLLGEQLDPFSPRGSSAPAPFRFSPAPDLRDPDDSWDPTPGIDHDLEGHPVAPVTEDPWHDRPRPHHPD